MEQIWSRWSLQSGSGTKPHRISTSSGSGSGILLAGSSVSAGNLLSDLQQRQTAERQTFSYLQTVAAVSWSREEKVKGHLER